MTDLSDLYSARILELAAGLKPMRRLAHPDATARAHSKLCGSTIEVDVAIKDGRIADYGQSVKACLLGQSAAAVMEREIVGSTPQELRDVAARMRDMLKASGDPPSGRWADLQVLAAVREVKARHASTLLVFDAVERALDAIDTAPVPGPVVTKG